jgi:hypothetical protein
MTTVKLIVPYARYFLSTLATVGFAHASKLILN